MTKSSRYIFYIIVVGLFCHIFSLFFAQMSMHGQNSTGVTGAWYAKLTFVADIVLSLVSIYCFITYKKSFPAIINIFYILMILLVFIASLSDLSLFSTTPTVFYSPKGIGTWINFGLLYFSAEEDYSKKIFKMYKYACYALILFNVMQIALLGSVSNRADALNAVRDTTVALLWIYPFFFLDNDDKTTAVKLLKYFCILLCAFFAFAIASRSYLLIVGIFMFIKLRRDLKEGRNYIIIAAMAALGLLAVFYIVSNLDKFGTIKDMTSVFTGRMGEDSRSSQLKEFMDQYNSDKLFTGVGPSATWNWSGDRKAPYEWLDNQFILTAWWFGIQTCFIYILFLFYSLFRKNTMQILWITNAKIMIFFWILACAGFGIYITISSSFYYFFITFLIGMVSLNIRHVKVIQTPDEMQVQF